MYARGTYAYTRRGNGGQMVAPAFAKGSKTGRKTGNTSTSISVALEVNLGDIV